MILEMTHESLVSLKKTETVACVPAPSVGISRNGAHASKGRMSFAAAIGRIWVSEKKLRKGSLTYGLP